MPCGSIEVEPFLLHTDSTRGGNVVCFIVLQHLLHELYINPSLKSTLDVKQD